MYWTPVAALLIALFLVPAQAHAYLDPGTGSAVIQMVVAGVMGALFVIKMYWRKLMAIFTGSTEGEAQTAANGSTADDERD
jgi:hypothetical protein